MKQYKLGLLGIGKMGSSILNGVINSKLYQKEEVLLFDINEEVKKLYEEKGYEIASDENEVIQKSDMVILALKPQAFTQTLKKIKVTPQNTVFISIAAGITIDFLREYLGDQKYIRVMPNTPALIGMGATAISKSAEVDVKTFEKVKTIFESIGMVKEIDEEKMNGIIPLNGSMPAYLYYFIQGFIESAVKEGIDYSIAKDLACHAVIGSANMILQTDRTIDELINDVCSPKGTTIAGLEVLKKRKFLEIIDEASQACIKRSKELGKM
ncbi:MAG: pyrroline-5-carboxylate reductase [Bacilli bacterium]|nr:pyrroline-5-carboxylate reductase [Bacilli bacterium]